MSSGQTPVQRARDRHDRLSAVGLIGVSPSRHHLSLYFHLVRENVDTDQPIWLLCLLHRHYRRHVIVIWDGLGAHRSAAAHFEKRHPGWFTFVPLRHRAGNIRSAARNPAEPLRRQGLTNRPAGGKIRMSVFDKFSPSLTR